MNNEKKQNKPMLLLGIALVIALLLAGFFLIKKSSLTKSLDKSNGSTQKTTEESGTVSGTLAQLIGMGKNMQCTFNYADKTYSNKGTMYVSGKNVRGDFDSVIDGKVSNMHMIHVDQYSYIWGSTMPEGIKMKDSAVPTGAGARAVEGNAGAQANQYFDANKKVDYKCAPWNANQSLFTVPEGVTFRDFSALMEDSLKKLTPTVAKVTGEPTQSIAGSAGGEDVGRCAACAQLQGDAKAMCEQQLGC